MPPIRKPAMRPTTSAKPPTTATSGAAPVSKPVVRAPTPQHRFPGIPALPRKPMVGDPGSGSSTLYDPTFRPAGLIGKPDPMAGIPGGGSSSGAGGGAGVGAGAGGPGVGGPFATPIGAGGPADIQSAISSLRGQLGMPGGQPIVSTPGSANPAVLNYVNSQNMEGGAGGAKPPWQQLAEMGIGGQGSPEANRIRLAAALAERRRQSMGGAGSAGGMGGAGGAGGAGSPLGGRFGVDPVAQADSGQAGQGQDTMNRDPATFGNPTGNPYLGLLRQRLGRQMAY